MVRRTYPSRSAKVSSKKPAILWSAAFAILLAGGAWLMMPASTLAVRSSDAAPAAGPASLSSLAPATEAKRGGRIIYPYSVVPGGVADGAQLARVIKSDKVVAAHYAEFNVAAAREVKLSKPRAVHVSYRKDDKIYWTANKVVLPAGETLLSDGVNEARTRCANRISDIAMLPVSADEPSAEVLDSSVEEGVEVSLLSGGTGDGNPATGSPQTFNTADLAADPALAIGSGRMGSLESFTPRSLSGGSGGSGGTGTTNGNRPPSLSTAPPTLSQAPQTAGSNGSGNPPANPPAGDGATGPADGNGEKGKDPATGAPDQTSTPPQFADDTADNELPSRQPIKPDVVGTVPAPGSLPTLNTGDPAGEASKIPEPATAGLFIGALAVLGLVRRRRGKPHVKAQ